AILTQGKHELRRRGSGHIDNSRTHPTQISVTVIEREAVGGGAGVGRMTGPERPGLQPNNSFAPHPIPTRVKCVTSDHEHVTAVASDAAVPPNPAADCFRAP